ncbi:MAG: response regulator [Candidatus Pacebacteria bacterium]|nr:response regulator [Candidatus Paceibacterota bacterium]
MEKTRISIVDDNSEFLEALEKPFKEKFEINTFVSADAFLESWRNGQVPDIVLTDYKMAEMNGLELCLFIRKKSRSIPIVLFSGWIDKEVALMAAAVGATDLLEKPFPLERITHALRRAEHNLLASRFQSNRHLKYKELSETLAKLAKNYEARYTFAENILLDLNHKALSGKTIAPQYLKSVSEGNTIHRSISAIHDEIKQLEEEGVLLEDAPPPFYFEPAEIPSVPTST